MALQSLQYAGYIKVDHANIEKDFKDMLDLNKDGKIDDQGQDPDGKSSKHPPNCGGNDGENTSDLTGGSDESNNGHPFDSTLFQNNSTLKQNKQTTLAIPTLTQDVDAAKTLIRATEANVLMESATAEMDIMESNMQKDDIQGEPHDKMNTRSKGKRKSKVITSNSTNDDSIFTDDDDDNDDDQN